MSGVAAIAGPSGERQVMLWRNNVTLNQLTLEMRNLDNQTYTKFVSNNPMKGYLRATSGLGATIHNHTVTVFGVTNWIEQSKSGQVVSSVSPIYNPIDSDRARADPGPDYDSIAATGDGTDYSYTYFLQDEVSGSKKPIVIEYEFNQANPGSYTPLTELNADPSSKLAAVTLPDGTRLIFFQKYEKHAISYAHSYPQTDTPINGTNNALLGTPLAASIVPGEGKTVEVYVYYVDNEYKLTRIVYTGDGVSGKWSSATTITKAGGVNRASGLAVIADVQRSSNHVYVMSSGSTYTDVVDPFKHSRQTQADTENGGEDVSQAADDAPTQASATETE